MLSYRLAAEMVNVRMQPGATGAALTAIQVVLRLPVRARASFNGAQRFGRREERRLHHEPGWKMSASRICRGMSHQKYWPSLPCPLALVCRRCRKRRLIQTLNHRALIHRCLEWWPRFLLVVSINAAPVRFSGKPKIATATVLNTRFTTGP